MRDFLTKLLVAILNHPNQSFPAYKPAFTAYHF